MRTSLTAKLVGVLLSLALLPLILIAFISFVNISRVYNIFSFNMETIQQNTYQESKRIIEKLTQENIKEISQHVAHEIELYLLKHNKLKLKDLGKNAEFQKIALQKIGKNSYTSIHQITGVENSQVIEAVPELKKLLEEHFNNGSEVGGFYDTPGFDGKIDKKFIYMIPIQTRTADGIQLGLKATASVDEYSGILSAINTKTSQILFQTRKDAKELLKNIYVRQFIILSILFFTIILVTLLFIRQNVKPIRQLIEEMNNFTLGNNQIKIKVKTQDEIGQLANSFDKMIQMIVKEEEKNKETYIGIMATLAKAIEAKDPYTLGHTERVTNYAVQIAGLMGLSRTEIEIIHKAAMIHDIGKIGIKLELLNKKETLTDEEREVIKSHPILGINILSPMKMLGDILPIIRYHHERFDGTGYPEKLVGAAIPLGARILTVADSFDAMTSDRPYHLRLSLDEAISELKNKAGTQFDPKVVETLLHILNKRQ